MVQGNKYRKQQGRGADEDRVEIDVGELFPRIGNLIEFIEKLGKEGGEIKRHGGISAPSSKAQGAYGVRIRTLAGSGSIGEAFGPTHEAAEGACAKEVREPFVDLFDEGDTLVIIAEIPGVAEEEIKLEVKGQTLRLSTSNEDRPYEKAIHLPSRVEADSLQSTYRNGVLRNTLVKADAGD